MTLRLDAGAAEIIAGGHDDAAAKIDEAAPSAPKKVDAGYGGVHVAEILAAVSETAGEIAAINTGIALLVRDCADDYGRTEQAIAAEFDRMGRLG
ncbi:MULTISPECIES: hypothetical protein [Nocardioides]|uniref:ESX-1 secretion-associated protein n=1 Tax=Nocardioides vastitatis TaxID=2568655 RepID=A0ABW0ZQG1_9ACTN|nr:hypothetical protein [Nocardioides sp.]THJ04466.1 hypothetical protein E7Z54_08215 [Nocardioides sp.]